MLSKHPPYNPVPYQGKLTVANLITDVTRAAGVEGDGLAVGSGVGVWPEATNRNVNGNATTNTTGVTDNSSTTSRVTTGTVKFGATAFEVVSGNATANEGPSQAISGGAAATVYTISAWAWLVSGAATVRVALYDSVSGKQGGTPVVLTTTPVRLTVTAMTGAASAGHASYVETTTQQAGTWRIGGWQVETGSIATPYIHTDGGTASRSVGRIQGPASVLSATQGWFALRTKMGWGNASAVPVAAPGIMSWSDTVNERIHPFCGVASWVVRRQTAGAGTDAYVLGTWASGDTITMIGAWTATEIKGSHNGAAFSRAGNTSIPTIARTTFDIANNTEATTRPLCSNEIWFATGRGQLTDADAALFNSWGNNRPLPHQFPRSADLRFLAHFYGDGTQYRYGAA